LIEYLVESNVAGAYQPHTQEILIIKENVDESNLDGLKLIVVHELVHRGQHVQFPHLFDRVDSAIQEIYEELERGESNLREVLQKMEEINPIMTLLESHAHYIQNLMSQSHFPKAEIESHFNMAALLMRLLGQKKISQYTEGIPEISAAMDSGGIDSLFSKY
jgi:hypothetical protein